MDNQPTSLSLLEGIKAGENEAWDRFVSVYGPVIYAKCRRAGLSETDAAELSQSIFLRIHKSIDRFQRDGAGLRFRFWLNTVVKSAVIDHVRQARKTPMAAGGTDFQGVINNVPEMLDESSFSYADSDSALIVQRVLKVIEQDFGPQTWQAFWLTTIEEKSAAEAGETLKMKPNAVRQAKHRVLKRLETELEGLLD